MITFPPCSARAPRARPGGEIELSSSTLIDLGTLPHSRSSSPRVEIDARMWTAMPEPVRSVVIYNYAEKTAHGTANLTEKQGSRPPAPRLREALRRIPADASRPLGQLQRRGATTCLLADPLAGRPLLLNRRNAS